MHYEKTEEMHCGKTWVFSLALLAPCRSCLVFVDTSLIFGVFKHFYYHSQVIVNRWHFGYTLLYLFQAKRSTSNFTSNLSSMLVRRVFW